MKAMSTIQEKNNKQNFTSGQNSGDLVGSADKLPDPMETWEVMIHLVSMELFMCKVGWQV